AAVLGGTQSLHTNSYDEALCLPSEDAVRVALRIQQILAHESGVANTVDPTGGSYFLETLTNQMEAKAMDYIDKIDNMGGVYEAIERGFFQQEIADSAFKYQHEIDMKKRTLVGVNEYFIDEPECPIELLRIDEKIEEEQTSRLRRLRHERDGAKVKRILGKLHDAADKDVNLMPMIIEAVKAYATLGEICDVLRNVYGEYQELIVV
ncbi:methylmalonyl-CoA mutase, partial [Candidatus Bathyarchaeota archaeon]|nr:methylmalonyl-CoA mutase [Candidatus Bathyarchaeota archaeon]